jgi:glycosyltransferase involved in cell wall biosynthesis
VPSPTDAEEVAGPEVSVVIPTRNRWRRLVASALPSALLQEDVRLEVLVVDDGSSDTMPPDSPALAHPLVRVLAQPASRGAAAARNAGVAAARGDWVAFLDDDDLWSPRKLRLQIDAAKAAHASFSFAGVLVVDEQRHVLRVLEPPAPAGLAKQLRERYVIPAGCSNVVVRRSLLEEVGGFDERLSFLADWDLWLRLADAGEAAACREPLVGYVNHDGSMIFGDARRLRAEIELFFEKHGDVTADPSRFSAWIAWEARRSGRRARAARMYLWAAWRYRTSLHVVRAIAALLAPRPRAAAPPEVQIDPKPAWLGLDR